MEKVAIGYRINLNVFVTVLMFMAGVAIIVGALLIFTLIIGGAIGGGIAGAMGAVGAMLCMTAVGAGTLPSELVHIDDTNLYLHKVTIALKDIGGVKADALTLIVIPKQGRRIRQGFLRNSAVCAKAISEKLQSSQQAT